MFGVVYLTPSLTKGELHYNLTGAGLIKVKSSDQKWKPGNMSAMDYFYETQVRHYYFGWV